MVVCQWGEESTYGNDITGDTFQGVGARGSMVLLAIIVGNGSGGPIFGGRGSDGYVLEVR